MVTDRLSDATVGTIDLAGKTIRRLGFGAMRASAARNADGKRDREEARRTYRTVYEHGVNFVDVANIWAVAWLLAHSPVTVPIPGTSKVSHAADNAAIGRLRLTHAEIARLDAVS